MLTGDIPRDIDITIDGADEEGPSRNLIKGGGGALLREKIIAQATKREVIVVDESKLSPGLGTYWALPVEVLEFDWRSVPYRSRKYDPRQRLRPDRRSYCARRPNRRSGEHRWAWPVHRPRTRPDRGGRERGSDMRGAT